MLFDRGSLFKISMNKGIISMPIEILNT